MLDTYRARLQGLPDPPAPGAQNWQVVREVRDQRRFRAVVAERPARGRLRAGLARRLHLRRTRPTC
ncbi:hypothetical protein [Streptomyces himalayensis]|uniref:hypothetical protein n=1 Tax=Streptomyces himalayensis TaxID=2820085 RepID=UPI001FE793DD|nr:hypothetical protein [Streptomyces himalayensis]